MSAAGWDVLAQPRHVPRTERAAKFELIRVLIKQHGVDSRALTNLVALQRALADDQLTAAGGEDKPTPEYVADLHAQLFALADNHDREAKARETEEAREAFCRRQGMQFTPREEAPTYGRGAQ